MQDKKGVVTGVVLSAFGFSAFLFSFLALAIMNPENEDPTMLPNGHRIYSEEIALRVPFLFKTLAVCFTVLGLICIAFIKRNPDFIEHQAEITENQLTVRDALHHRQFYLICLMDFLSIIPLMYMSGHYKVMGLTLSDQDDYTLTVIGSIGSLANGGSRVLMGPLQDKIGFSKVYLIILIIEFFVCFFITSVVSFNSTLYLIFVFLAFFCLGSHFTMFPIVMLKVFGLKSGGQLSSFIYCSRGLSSVCGLFIANYLKNNYEERSFSIMFFIGCGNVLVSLCIK